MWISIVDLAPEERRTQALGERERHDYAATALPPAAMRSRLASHARARDLGRCERTISCAAQHWPPPCGGLRGNNGNTKARVLTSSGNAPLLGDRERHQRAGQLAGPTAPVRSDARGSTDCGCKTGAREMGASISNGRGGAERGCRAARAGRIRRAASEVGAAADHGPLPEFGAPARAPPTAPSGRLDGDGPPAAGGHRREPHGPPCGHAGAPIERLGARRASQSSGEVVFSRRRQAAQLRLVGTDDLDAAA